MSIPEEMLAQMMQGEQPQMEEEMPQPQPRYEEPENKLSETEQRDLISKYESRTVSSQSGMSEHHKGWKIIDMFDRGRQWDNVKIPAWIPKPITNLIRYVRTTKRANLAQNVPQSQFTPLTPLDAPLVERLQKAYDHVWDEQKVPLTVRRSVDRALLHGTSLVCVYPEENIRGKWYGENHANNQLYRYDIKVKRLNNGNFFPDPSAYSIQEMKFATVTENLAFSDVKNNPKYREFAGEKLDNLTYADFQRDDSANGEIFDRPTGKDPNQRIEGDDMVTMHIHWERYRNEDGGWQVDCSYYLWGTDFFLYRIEDVKPSVYPFAKYDDEEEDNSFWGSSTAMDMLENQKIINKTAQAASIIGTLHQNPQKVVLRESGINAAEMSRTGTLPGKVWTSNIPNAVETIQPPDIPKGLFEIEDRMKNDIKDMAGITESYTGESVGSLTTSTGVDSLIERSTIRDKDKSIQIDAFVEDLSNIIIQFIIHYWQEERPIMVRKQNGEAAYDTWQPIPPEIIDNLEWRVRSDVYAKAPMTQASRSQAADNLMQMQGQFQYDPPIITPIEWINMKDFPNKEDIIARMEADQKKKDQQMQTDFQGNILGLIQQAQEMKGQGLTEEEIQQQISPMIDEMVQATFTSGTGQGQAGQLSSQSQAAPSGTIGMTAMGNMTQG